MKNDEVLDYFEKTATNFAPVVEKVVTKMAAEAQFDEEQAMIDRMKSNTKKASVSLFD